MCKIDLEKIKGRISESRTGLNDIAVQGMWNVKYINPVGLSDEELLTAVIYAYNTLSVKGIFTTRSPKAGSENILVGATTKYAK